MKALSAVLQIDRPTILGAQYVIETLKSTMVGGQQLLVLDGDMKPLNGITNSALGNVFATKNESGYLYIHRYGALEFEDVAAAPLTLGLPYQIILYGNRTFVRDVTSCHARLISSLLGDQCRLVMAEVLPIIAIPVGELEQIDKPSWLFGATLLIEGPECLQGDIVISGVPFRVLGRAVHGKTICGDLLLPRERGSIFVGDVVKTEK